MPGSFWYDVLANFLSDFMVGVVLGALLALWVGKRLSRLERTQQSREEQRTNLSKTVDYLESLRDEVDDLLERLSQVTAEEAHWQTLRDGWEFITSAPYLRTLMHSEELVRSVDPLLIAPLHSLNEALVYAERQMHMATQANGIDGLQYMANTTLGLKLALEVGETIPEKVSSEISILKKRASKL